MDTASTNGASSGPIAAIANAIGEIFGVIGGAQQLQQTQLDMLPDHVQLSYFAQREQDKTTPIVAGVLGLVVVALLVAVLIIALRK